MTAQVSLEQKLVSILPGGEARLVLKLANPTDVVDIFDVTVLGLAAPFASVVPSEVHLFPRAQGEVAIVVKLPADTQLAGQVSIGFKITSRANPMDSVVEEATLEVAGQSRVSIVLHPRRVEGKLRSRHQVMLTNAGNQPATVDLSGTDPSDELSLRFRPEHLVIGPGMSVKAGVKVTALHFSAGTDRPFQVFAQVLGQGVQSADGTLAQRRTRPGWLVPLVALVVAGVVVALVLKQRSQPHSTATQDSQLAANGQATTVNPNGSATSMPSGAATTKPGSATTKPTTTSTTLPSGGTSQLKPLSFLHTASAGNSSGNQTTVDNPATNNDPNAILVVTPNWSPPGGQNVYDVATLGVYYFSGKWRIFHQDHSAVPAGAGYDVQVYPAPGPQAFVDTATAANSSGDQTTIDNPATNNNPNAIVLLTPNWSPPGGQNIYDPATLGVYYFGGKWRIFHQDQSAVPPGASYNVEAYPGPGTPGTGAQRFIDTAIAANNSGDQTTIDNPATNNNPNAIVVVTPNWSPPGGQNVYDKATLGVYYSNAKWRIFHQDKTAVPVGASYNVAVGP